MKEASQNILMSSRNIRRGGAWRQAHLDVSRSMSIADRGIASDGTGTEESTRNAMARASTLGSSPPTRERSAASACRWHGSCSKPDMAPKVAPIILTVLMVVAGCATTLEQNTTSGFARSDRRVASESRRTDQQRPLCQFDGTLSSYLACALDKSPELRATFEDYRAATHRIAQARRLPEPTFTYAYFVRSVETRVGPQRHRFGVSQAFPWPTKLSAGADAASLAARSARQQYEASALLLARKVAEAYWKLWVIQRTREVERDQKRLLEHLSALARARVEIGQSGLADLGQIDLKVSRLADVLSGLGEAERAARAELLAAVGAEPDTPTPIAKNPPPLMRVVETQNALRTAALAHPGIQAIGTMPSPSSSGPVPWAPSGIPGSCWAPSISRPEPSVEPIRQTTARTRSSCLCRSSFRSG